MRKDKASDVWVVYLTNGKELLLREADMKMLPGVLRADDDKPKSGKTPSDKPKTEEQTSIYVPPPPGITNPAAAKAANLAAINAMQSGRVGMSKGMKLMIVGVIVIILIALLGGAYMFMGSSSPNPVRGYGRRPDI